ncbi:MAG TPA: hypothetical protein VFQ76_15840 [Longimicrobiaceae bacterium]|nr:hypothetical protein [Longimicrobiaceae bacterium]
MAETPLASVPGWSPDQVARMETAWVTTAEQVVALSGTTNGIRSLGEQLEVSEDEAERLVEAARSTLDPAARAELEEGVDTSEYGLGALRPRERNDG